VKSAAIASFVRGGAGTDKCWYWLGAVNNRGYGVFRVGRRVVVAHRHMFELEHGRPPSGMVLHTCGKKTCVNPKHLYEGSKPKPHDADAELLERIDRAALPSVSQPRGSPGSNNPWARLADDQVRKICAAQG